MVRTEINKVFDIKRAETLKYKDKPDSENVYTSGMFLPLILTYSFKYTENNISLYNIVHKLQKEMPDSSKKTTRVFWQ